MKVRIFAEESALIQLIKSNGFINGRYLKTILKNSKLYLIMDEDKFESMWNDSESDIRKFCLAYDIPRPEAVSGLRKVYEKPILCTQLDPYAIWLLNKSDEDILKFKDYLGVWAISPNDLLDDFFCIEHKRVYSKDDVINGPKQSGWGNFLAELPKDLPPLNSIVVNDRYLLLNTNENNAEKVGFWGLKNLKALFEVLLPSDLKVTFHILLLCQHPDLDVETTNRLIEQFISDIKQTRNYKIEIEFFYSKSQHKRGLYSNYFIFDVDRAFNAFYANNLKVLNGENNFGIKTYMNDPLSTGDTEYDIARKRIEKIKEECINAKDNPYFDPDHNKNTIDSITECDGYFYNRLFF